MQPSWPDQTPSLNTMGSQSAPVDWIRLNSMDIVPFTPRIQLQNYADLGILGIY